MQSFLYNAALTNLSYAHLSIFLLLQGLSAIIEAALNI